MKILWLKSELLHPVDKGGRIRTYYMLRHIRREHHVTYLSLLDRNDPPESFDRAKEYCDRLVTVPWNEPRRFSARFYRDLIFNLGSPLPYAIQKYHSTAMRREIERELRERDYDVVVCDFLVPSVNLNRDLGVPTVLFQHNVESMIWQRHHQTETNRIKKAYFYNQWKKMYSYERRACRSFDAVVAVSPVDRDLIRDEYGVREVYDIPTGVDTEYFRPMNGPRNPFELVFTGSMDWMPNEDGITHFAESILPRIARAIPDVSLTVVGRNPSRRLRALADSNRQIKVVGRVEDVRPYVARAAAYIVPLRVGGGTRLKLYEAMAMAKPVISTSIGAEGLPVRAGEDLLIADGPDRFAQAVISVLTDESLAKKIGRQSCAAVREQFGWNRAASTFARVCEAMVRGSLPQRAA
jgi:sugar transferase (PEP-CTERM/EpsH1 system associated)